MSTARIDPAKPAHYKAARSTIEEDDSREGQLMKSSRLSKIMGWGAVVLTAINLAGCGRGQTASQTKQGELPKSPDNLPEKTTFRLHEETKLEAHSSKTLLPGSCTLHHDEHPQARILKETVEFEVRNVAVGTSTSGQSDSLSGCYYMTKDVVYSLESRGGFTLKATCSGEPDYDCDNNHFVYLPLTKRLKKSFRIELPNPIEIDE